MIKILGDMIDPGTFNDLYVHGSIESRILGILFSSNTEYTYDSADELKFELDLRKNIIGAALDLNRSSFSFKVFRKSKCNQEYWHRTSEGGFMLESGVKPSDAINDIYSHSFLYGTECSTAVVIVYYKALADVLPGGLFNKLFSEIYLMNWTHLDPDIGIADNADPADHIPGDGRYFRNPDVDPLYPEWQGENAIDLGNDMYYGHGIGVENARTIINALNRKRIDGSTVSAYLMNNAKRPDFASLSKKVKNYVQVPQA